ncbi:MAG: glutamate-5-semialdehyde dehydrogenase [Bdellovibrionales bacterium]|nr:glutamate-5-semialdehyde dehydrogenase [Bdellovibrionales bacterium]
MAGAPEASELQLKIAELGRRARGAALRLNALDSSARKAALEQMAAALEAATAQIQAANQRDVEAARAEGLSSAMLDRLELTPARIAAMIAGVRQVAALPDPVGETINERERPNGLRIRKVRVPLGVIAIIYESRPNVTADAAALCVKTGNAVILRGGKEATFSNRAIAEALRHGLAASGVPADAVQLVQEADREAVRELVRLDEYVDVVIPRGGEGLIRAVAEMATVPLLKHYKGVCHVFVDKSADPNMALEICLNAKCQRPGVCNAMETLLVHKAIAETFLPSLAQAMGERGVELRVDQAARQWIPQAHAATDCDWGAEYLDLILAVRVVDSVEEAIAHINTYGSRHTDAIVARDEQALNRFVTDVDSGVVVQNASTRFNDGGEFGMGAEMGISTDKLHARGPVGPEELTTYKYVVTGSGQVRG